MVKAVIFDFDGVLVDSEIANIEAGKKTFEDRGTPLTEDEVLSIVGRSSRDFVPAYLSKRGITDPAVHESTWKINAANYDELWPKVVKLTPGVDEVIPALKEKGLKLAIATTNRLSTVNTFFKTFGFQDAFSAIVTGEDVKRRKPDPEVYTLVVQKLSLNPGDCVAVEDTAIGVASAKAANLRCVAVPNHHTQNDDFSKADYIIKSMDALVKLTEEF